MAEGSVVEHPMMAEGATPEALAEAERREKARREMVARVDASVVVVRSWNTIVEKDPEDLDGPPQKVKLPESRGSAFFVRPDGYLMTNKHCTQGETITVLFSSGKEVNARVVYKDRHRDIAILKVDGIETTPLPLADSDELHRLDPLWLIGAPAGMEGNTVAGVVSNLPSSIGDRTPLQIEDFAQFLHEAQQNPHDTSKHFDGFIRTDADMHGGNSGGPMLNYRGEVIGINAMIRPTEGGSIGMAIPVNEVKAMIEHPELFAEVSQTIDDVVAAKAEYDLRLSETFDAALTLTQLVFEQLADSEKGKAIIQKVMSDRGIRRLFQDMLRHPATKREVYAKKFFDQFGVNLYEPGLQTETEVDAVSNIDFVPDASEEDKARDAA
ncbi:trypsin-like peptidase domain-containing protein [Patescibacteria group bacterium]|nr:trypsin-like peptidase domain-containing protein [Patescibacteria group bacterium]